MPHSKKLETITLDVIGPHNKRLRLFALQGLRSMNESAESDLVPATQGAY